MENFITHTQIPIFSNYSFSYTYKNNIPPNYKIKFNENILSKNNQKTKRKK